MAATHHTDSQPNDVNCDKGPPQPPPARSAAALLQNGTDKAAAGGGRAAATPPGGSGPASPAPAPKSKNNGGTKPDLTQYEPPPAPDSEPAPAAPPPLEPMYPLPPDASPQDAGHAAYYPAYMPADTGGVHAFGPRPPFPTSAANNPPPKHPPPRFAAAGQAATAAGPTPTLNELLSGRNSMPQRYQNNYPDQQYTQNWPPQKGYPQAPAPQPPPAAYRSQSAFPLQLSPAAYGGGGAPGGMVGYGGDARPGWVGGPPGGGGGGPPGHQHGPPGSPGGPPNTQAPASQPSPQPSQPPSHSPGPGGGGMPPSPQHPSAQQGFQSRPPPPTTPNANAPDAADLSGGNSNDSSGGPAPGTPNSSGMRPTPSPTGSTGSRSMSPAVGQNIPMPPRPSSGQSDGGGPTRISHSPMVTQGGGYSPHPPHGYKTHPSMAGTGPAGQQMPPYQQYPQGGYPPRPPANVQYPGYGPPGGGQLPPSNNMPPQQPVQQPPQQFGNRSAPNHMQNSQFPYQQGWPASVSTGAAPVKGNGNNNPPLPSGGSQSPTPRPPNYLKHHLQHKMGFSGVPGSAPPSPSPPQNFHMGPPPTGHHHSGMGPPPTMGPPPNMPPTNSPLLPNNHPHEGGPMPPPSSTPNSHSQLNSELMDNGITTTAQGGLNTHVTAAAAGSVTSVVTTGPDGTPVDEGSQQSTLSNASAASVEDPQCTSIKGGRKNDMGHYSHPATPQSTVPSPGAASMNSMHEDYGEINSPSWPRTPASPVFNSHVPPPDTYRSKKTDSLSKLYEMDDSPDRRVWLDKLLSFMDERRTPITTCPTISKNPLDLFRLYMYVKERGGFMEVTKNKTWKDIAGMLGIGASSSAAYTLRKHYTKNLLAYECQFDRGGIDPQPIINQVEASSKKKGAKTTSVPSPGSSNSQDSFPAPGSGGASMDGYGYGGYPQSGGNPDYPPPQRPSSQSAPSPHGGSGGANHLNNAAPGGPSPAGGAAADNVNVSNPFDDVSPSPPPPPPRGGGQFPGGPHPPYPAGTPPRPPGQNYSGQPGYSYPGPGPGGPNAPPDQYSPYSTNSGYPPAVRPVYPPYSGDAGAPPQPNPSNTQGPPATPPQDPYNRYNAPPGAGYTPRPSYGATPPAAGPPATQQPPAGPGPYPSHQDYYRPEQAAAAAAAGGVYPGGPTAQNKTMPPPGPQPPRRHPDFAKDQPYTPYGQPRTPIYSGWPNSNQYRPPQYGGAPPGAPGAPQVGSQQWNQGGGRSAGPWPANQGAYQPPQPGQTQWQAMPSPSGQNNAMRPVQHRSGKPFMPIMPPSGGAGTPPAGAGAPVPGAVGTKPGTPTQPGVSNSYNHSQIHKREITFPPDSVEATMPVLYRRKRLCRADIGQVDPWRIIMCLRSGLLSESTYALDMLNVLLFDDSSVGYFGLSQWPGLLDLLMEHFRKSLSGMFDGRFQHEIKAEDPSEVDLGGVISPIDPSLKTTILHHTTNYTLITRKGHPVKLVDRNEDIFVQDNLKDWDVRGDANRTNILAEIPTDPWHATAEHILEPFQAEFSSIPFHTRLEDKKRAPTPEEPHENKPSAVAEEPTPAAPPPQSKPSDKNKRRTLSDVISRIKKDSLSESGGSEVPAEPAPADKVKTEDSDVSKTCEDEETPQKAECIRDTAGTLKRRRISDYEDEAYTRDEASLVLLTESQDNVGKRCVCMSNILRSLTFVPGNELEFSRSPTFLALVGKLLLLHHEHPPRTQKTRNYDREEDADFADSCSSLQGEDEWWWDFLVQIRENILVSIANISGQIDVSVFSEEVARPLLDGLLHWAICPSATGQDAFASVGPSSLLSPQRLALEALCKLCVTNSNVDLVIATPPFSRLERLCAVLTKHLCRSEDQVLREFSINLLHYLSAADSSMARVVAAQTPCVSLLVAFIEQAEQSALGVANQHGISALRDNPDSMGTSLDMLRRAAATLVFLARHPDNKPLLVQQESRLLALVMSQILDQQVALLLAKVLFQISRS